MTPYKVAHLLSISSHCVTMLLYHLTTVPRRTDIQVTHTPLGSCYASLPPSYVSPLCISLHRNSTMRQNTEKMPTHTSTPQEKSARLKSSTNASSITVPSCLTEWVTTRNARLVTLARTSLDLTLTQMVRQNQYQSGTMDDRCLIPMRPRPLELTTTHNSYSCPAVETQTTADRREITR